MEAKPALTFKEVLNCLQQAAKVVGDGDVDIEVWLGEKMYRINMVGQFNIVPTVTLTLTDAPEIDLNGWAKARTWEVA